MPTPFIDTRTIHTRSYAVVGTFDAKTRLSELLRNVQNGQCYTITARGRPIADLVPSSDAADRDARVAVRAMRDIRKVQGVSGETVAQWAAEGRR
uniref:Prevent-host-death family protein n=1 Tax=Candidatus Kentrum sp. DK TaxID=2126562 RepID=A0A450SRS9_9GAMM|nr:MAG: prevent-host-death family protein [Candidatus Kentron sp. DK]